MVVVDLGFCPRCGGHLGPCERGGHHRSCCSTCGFTVYRNPFPVVVATVVDGDRALFVRRARASENGHWSLPGSYMEVDEAPEVGAARELAEETGIDVEPSDLTFVGTTYESLGQGEGIVLIVFAVARERTDGEPVPGEDASEVRFWTRAEIAENPPNLRAGDPTPILWAIDSLGSGSRETPLW